MRDRQTDDAGRLPDTTTCYQPLKRADQATIAALAFALFLVACGHALRGQLSNGGWHSRDDATPLSAQFQVDLNEATWPEIAALPGIGERTARSIVDFRRDHGPFSTLRELDMMEGIGAITIARIAGHVDIPSGIQRELLVADRTSSRTVFAR